MTGRKGIWLPVTFRLARSSDRETFPWRPMGLDQTRPLVCTVQGVIAYMKHHEHRGEERILYQDDHGGLADLLRAEKYVLDAVRDRHDRRWEW